MIERVLFFQLIKHQDRSKSYIVAPVYFFFHLFCFENYFGGCGSFLLSIHNLSCIVLLFFFFFQMSRKMECKYNLLQKETSAFVQCCL